MSLMGKIFVSLLVLLAVYIFWPRQAMLVDFTPEKLAAGEVQAWQALRKDSRLAATAAFYTIYNGQFSMGPVQALNLSSKETKGIGGVLNSPDESAQTAFEPVFIEAATLFMRETRGPHEGINLGRANFHLWGALADRDDTEKMFPFVVSQLTHWFGLPADKIQPAAEMRSRALTTAFHGEEADVDWDLVSAQLSGSWQLIHELLLGQADQPE
jgi:hypothetical protein